MFRRWRRAKSAAHASPAPVPRPSAADLRGEHIFDLVYSRLAEFIGPRGQWSLVRRETGDTDAIFHAMLTHQIAAAVTRTMLEEREQVAVVVPEGAEPVAMSWTPAPLVVWADPVAADDAASDPAPATEDDADDVGVEVTARAA